MLKQKSKIHLNIIRSFIHSLDFSLFVSLSWTHCIYTILKLKYTTSEGQMSSESPVDDSLQNM